MKRILSFLINHGSKLYEELECKIIDSTYSDSFGGTGSITMANSKVMICIWLDRDALFVNFSRVKKPTQSSWYSLDIVKRYLHGTTGTGELTIDNISFMLDNFTSIETIFCESEWEQNEKKLKSLEKDRSKRLFG